MDRLLFATLYRPNIYRSMAKAPHWLWRAYLRGDPVRRKPAMYVAPYLGVNFTKPWLPTDEAH